MPHHYSHAPASPASLHKRALISISRSTRVPQNTAWTTLHQGNDSILVLILLLFLSMILDCNCSNFNAWSTTFFAFIAVQNIVLVPRLFLFLIPNSKFNRESTKMLTVAALGMCSSYHFLSPRQKVKLLFPAPVSEEICAVPFWG